VVEINVQGKAGVRHLMRFRIDNFRVGGSRQRQHTHSGCGCHLRVPIESPVKGIGNFECLTGLGSAGHKSSAEARYYPRGCIKQSTLDCRNQDSLLDYGANRVNECSRFFAPEAIVSVISRVPPVEAVVRVFCNLGNR
jgi:hypothetical protein